MDSSGTVVCVLSFYYPRLKYHLLLCHRGPSPRCVVFLAMTILSVSLVLHHFRLAATVVSNNNNNNSSHTALFHHNMWVLIRREVRCNRSRNIQAKHPMAKRDTDNTRRSKLEISRAQNRHHIHPSPRPDRVHKSPVDA